jgi:hypothetical protein
MAIHTKIFDTLSCDNIFFFFWLQNGPILQKWIKIGKKWKKSISFMKKKIIVKHGYNKQIFGANWSFYYTSWPGYNEPRL